MIRFDNHAFKGLDEALKRLYALLTDMGQGLDTLLVLMPQSLERSDPDAFAQAKEVDRKVNELELQTDAAVAAIINKFTVMGEDLRFVLGAVKIAGTLERAADKGKNCIKRLSRVSRPIEAAVRGELARAIESLQAMPPIALTLLVDYQPEAARTLLMHGAIVQQSYKAILLQLHAHTAPAEDEAHLLLVAKNLEQMADMAVEVMKIAHFVNFATKYDKASQNS